MHNVLGIIAGTGDLPRLLIDICKKTHHPFFIIAHHNYTDEHLIDSTTPHEWFALGQVGKALQAMRAHNVTDIVLAGGGTIARPSFRNLSLDKEGSILLAKLGLRWLGDNTMLKTVSTFLEERGFCIKSPKDFLSTITAQPGLWTQHAPSEEDREDIAYGRMLLETLSPLDFGQGIAIEKGLILGIEAAEGTDACIRRCGALKRGDKKPVYIKRAKIGQDHRLDLPVIGPNTIHALADAGFAGLACQAHDTLVLSLHDLCAMANDAGLFLLAE